jgi:hypothetical protein
MKRASVCHRYERNPIGRLILYVPAFSSDVVTKVMRIFVLIEMHL